MSKEIIYTLVANVRQLNDECKTLVAEHLQAIEDCKADRDAKVAALLRSIEIKELRQAERTARKGSPLHDLLSAEVDRRLNISEPKPKPEPRRRTPSKAKTKRATKATIRKNSSLVWQRRSAEEKSLLIGRMVAGKGRSDADRREMVRYANLVGFEEAAQKFNVSPRTIEWWHYDLRSRYGAHYMTVEVSRVPRGAGGPSITAVSDDTERQEAARLTP